MPATPIEGPSHLPRPVEQGEGQAARPCPGFDWLYARAGRCSYCRRLPWQHNRMIAFTPEGLTPVSWPAAVVRDWQSQGLISVTRAQQLHDTTTSETGEGNP